MRAAVMGGMPAVSRSPDDPRSHHDEAAADAPVDLAVDGAETVIEGAREVATAAADAAGTVAETGVSAIFEVIAGLFG